MPGKAPRQKGDRLERTIVELLRSHGLDAHRMPLSGAQNGFKGDVEIRTPVRTLKLESKSRKRGLSTIYQWLGTNDWLVLKEDRRAPVVVMRLDAAATLLGSQKEQQSQKPKRILSLAEIKRVLGERGQLWQLENGDFIGAVDTAYSSGNEVEVSGRLGDNPFTVRST